MNKNKKTPLKPQKKYFDLKVEVMLPAVITYRIFAETPEEAIQLMKNSSPNGVKHKLAGRKDIKITVYDAGSTLIRLIKNLVGR